MRVDFSVCDDRVYLDTNLFIYAVDSYDLRKHQIAKKLVDLLLSRGLGFYSAQVVSEWRNVMVRKYSDKVSADFRISFIRWLSSNGAVPVTGDLICRAEETSSKYCFSTYDSMHIQAALDLGCRYFLSEDMQDGLMVNDQLEIINPFV